MNEMHDKLLASLEAADARLVALEKQQLDVEERAIEKEDRYRRDMLQLQKQMFSSTTALMVGSTEIHQVDIHLTLEHMTLSPNATTTTFIPFYQHSSHFFPCDDDQ